jgi:hypothetical protein
MLPVQWYDNHFMDVLITLGIKEAEVWNAYITLSIMRN